jgi:hypothetical protein
MFSHYRAMNNPVNLNQKAQVKSYLPKSKLTDTLRRYTVSSWTAKSSYSKHRELDKSVSKSFSSAL